MTELQLTAQPPVQVTDRSEAQRTPVQIMVRIATINSLRHVADGVVLDLSERGCKICSALVLPMGTVWDLHLTIPETSDPALIVKVQVVWAVDNEYGIEFLRVKTGADPATPFHLEAYKLLHPQGWPSLVCTC